MTSIDVIVPTWKGRELLAGCLDHLAAQTAQHTVFVADNASGDGTIEMLRERFPAVRVLELSSNLGFGRAINEAARAGSGELLVLVNNDVETEPGFLEAIAEPFADPRVGMVAGITMIPGSGLVDGFGIELDPTLAAYNRMRGEAPEPITGKLAVPSGGAAAYRRGAFEQAGGFDERLFAYGEDLDLGLRLLAAGWSCAAAPGARAVHLGGATVGVDSPWQRRLSGFARGYVLRRYGLLRRRHALRTLAFETITVLWGLVRHRTTMPLRARLSGWRAGRGEHRPIATAAINDAIGWREQLRRLRDR